MNTTWYLHSHVVCFNVSYVCIVYPFVNFERFTIDRLRIHSRSRQTPGVSPAKLEDLDGIKCSVCDNLEKGRWEKLIWNVPFNGLGVAGVAGVDALIRGEMAGEVTRRDCLATDELLGDARWETLVRGLMLEIIQAAARLGHVIPESTADKMIERTRKLGAYRASTLVDYERGQPLELESIFLEPFRQARAAGARTPLLEKLCTVLGELDRRR